jgi:hypothetical protein
MPSADQVPVKIPHSTMRWHEWVVLIRRIDRLWHYVLFALPTFTSRRVMPSAISVTPRVRRVLCSARPWP